MIKIYPGITTTNKEEFGQILSKLKGLAPVIAVDISDGLFVPAKLLGIEEVQSASDQIFQVHLMLYKPEEAIARLLRMPNVESIIFHIEATDKPLEMIDNIHAGGRKAGVALNPETAVAALEPFVDKADFFQFMTVHPGGYGGEFQPQVLDKISSFHEKYPYAMIEVDGGANLERVSAMVKAGATMIESGSYIINSDDPVRAIEELRKIGENK